MTTKHHIAQIRDVLNMFYDTSETDGRIKKALAALTLVRQDKWFPAMLEQSRLAVMTVLGEEPPDSCVGVLSEGLLAAESNVLPLELLPDDWVIYIFSNDDVDGIDFSFCCSLTQKPPGENSTREWLEDRRYVCASGVTPREALLNAIAKISTVPRTLAADTSATRGAEDSSRAVRLDSAPARGEAPPRVEPKS